MEPASGWLTDAKLRVGYGAVGNNRIDNLTLPAVIWRNRAVCFQSFYFAGFCSFGFGKS
jgi:hypothetical protein